MREIKFRAWDIEKKIYIGFGYGKYTPFKGNNFTDPAFDSDFDGMMTLLNKWYCGEYYNVIWEQYTESKDKNNKELYEGDIVESGLTKQKYVIVFENGSWVGRAVKSGLQLLKYDQFEFSKYCGNIHENPKLLK